MDNYTWRRVTSFGTEGTEAGNFCRPWGVAITRYSDSAAWSNYLIAIADRSNNRIQVFKFDAISQTVTFLHMFGDGPGTRHGQFDRPAGIVFNPALEHIVVADKDNHRVQVFDLSGSYLFKFGERGSKSGQFCYPWDIDVCNATHNILVSDTRNRRVQIFSKLGRYITHFNQPLDSPRGVVYLNPNRVLISDFNKHRLIMITQNEEEHQVTSSTHHLIATSGNSNGTNSYLINSNNTHAHNNFSSSNNNNEYNLNNLPHQQKAAITIASTKPATRSQHLPTHLAGKNAAAAIATTTSNQQQQQQTFYESKFIGFGEGSLWGEFLRPQGVTANGSIVFCSDSRNNRVACWNKDTKSFNYISQDIVELDRPAGLAAIDSYIVIVDFGNNRVHICQYMLSMDTYNWRLVTSFGTEGTEAGNFCRPWGVAITRYSDSAAWSNYLIAIADRSNNRIQVFKFDAISQTVTFLHMFGDGPGTRHGQFDRPAGIVFNPALEHIVVADKDNHRVQVFDLSGSYLFKFGERGSKSGQFCYPWDIDVCNATHNILVSDTRNRRVQIFSKLGRYITHFNQPLDSPRGVAYLSPNRILVSDFNKHRLIMITQNEEEHTVTSSTHHLIATSGNSNGTSSYLSNNGNNNIDYQSLNDNNKAITITRPQPQTPLLMQLGKTQQTFYESKFIGFGEGSSWGEFLRPQGVTTNGSIVFCSDSRNNRVACWNKDTKSFNYISKDIVELDRPAGLAAIDSYIVIVDFGNNRVHICQNTGSMQAF